MNNKKYYIYIQLLLSIFIFNSTELEMSPEINGTINKIRTLNNMDILKISFWTGYTVNGGLGFFTMIGQTINAIEIKNKLDSISSNMNTTYGTDMSELTSFANAYPVIVFGINSIAAGTSFIPVTGGVIYGTLNYSMAILLATLSSVYPFRLPYFNDFPGYKDDSLYNDIVQVNTSMFDPTSYFAVGTISIISGIVEFILYFHYQREIRRNKYPYFQKIITMIPGGISIGLKL
ncbi:MAG: hypothetical protein A2355_01075 [Spirochaetes bacterium RIFOXYB1_FULL_32_8]|nr:MAG: hypothetical protein A2355_01075 [Spirochaetes bacterium RIFOXYB1_FULL_32_8]